MGSLDVDPDVREEFYRVHQTDEMKVTDEELSSEISDIQFLNMELALLRDGEGPEFARATKRLRDEDRNPVG
jgi:hypothetical protein